MAIRKKKTNKNKAKGVRYEPDPLSFLYCSFRKYCFYKSERDFRSSMLAFRAASAEPLQLSLILNTNSFKSNNL